MWVHPRVCCASHSSADAVHMLVFSSKARCPKGTSRVGHFALLAAKDSWNNLNALGMATQAVDTIGWTRNKWTSKSVPASIYKWTVASVRNTPKQLHLSHSCRLCIRNQRVV